MINAAISVLPWRFHGLRRKYSPRIRREPLLPPAGLFACIINSSVGLPSSGSTNALHSIPAHPRCCWTPAAAVALCFFLNKSPAGGLRQHQDPHRRQGSGAARPLGPRHREGFRCPRRGAWPCLQLRKEVLGGLGPQRETSPSSSGAGFSAQRAL